MSGDKPKRRRGAWPERIALPDLPGFPGLACLPPIPEIPSLPTLFVEAPPLPAPTLANVFAVEGLIVGLGAICRRSQPEQPTAADLFEARARRYLRT